MGLRKEGGGGLLESVVLIPCLALWELTSRSAWRAMLMGSWPSNSLDMVKDVLSLVLGSGKCFCCSEGKEMELAVGLQC